MHSIVRDAHVGQDNGSGLESVRGTEATLSAGRARLIRPLVASDRSMSYRRTVALIRFQRGTGPKIDLRELL